VKIRHLDRKSEHLFNATKSDIVVSVSRIVVVAVSYTEVVVIVIVPTSTAQNTVISVTLHRDLMSRFCVRAAPLQNFTFLSNFFRNP
jgi:hypothetical protein